MRQRVALRFFAKILSVVLFLGLQLLQKVEGAVAVFFLAPVSAVFMGEDSSAGAAAQIYGKNMARIRA